MLTIPTYSQSTMSFFNTMKAFSLMAMVPSVSMGFLLSQIKTMGPSKLSNGFIRTGSRSVDNFVTPVPDFSVVVLPGTLVSPSKYEPVCHQIESTCKSNNITADVSIAQFTLNVGHRFEVESMVEKIKKEVRSENVIIVGHSASAVVGAQIAEDVNAAGFVQWCGTFNSIGDFPWDCIDPSKFTTPTMAILAEHDSLFSFPTSIREFCRAGNYTSRVIPTSVKDSGHFSGVYMDDREFDDLPKRLRNTIESTGTSVDDLFEMEVVSVSWRIAQFMGYLNGAPKETSRVENMGKHFRSKFGELANTHTRDDVKTMLYGPDSSVNHVHTVNPPGLLYSLLHAAFPEGRSLITLSTVVLPFIFTLPGISGSVSVSSVLNPFPTSFFSNPSIWVKMPYKGPDDYSKEINTNTFEKALADVSESDRQDYFNFGRPMVFAKDTNVPKIPGCGPMWVATPLVVNDEGNHVSVSSPVIKLDKTLNTKLISRKQCLEWILVKCFK